MKTFSEFLHEDYLTEGGHDYIMHVPSDKESDVHKHWDEQKKRDSENDDAEGYSGDSRTFNRGIDFHRHTTHPNRDAAHKYILDKHQKWDRPIAVKYKHTDGKIHHAVGGWAST